MFTKNRERGVILISVLLIVLVLSAIAMSIGNNYLLAFKREVYQNIESNGVELFKNIEALSIKKIEEKNRFGAQILTKDDPLLNETLSFQLPNGQLYAKISDASNCLNINSIVYLSNNNYLPNPKGIAVLKRFLAFKEFDQRNIDSLIEQMIDWIDIDNQPRAGGLEDYFYTGPLHSPQQYTSKRLFFDLSELKNLPASRFFNWKDLSADLCAIPLAGNSRTNINTLTGKDSLLLAAMLTNSTINDAEFIIANIPKEGFVDISQLIKQFPSIDFSKSSESILFSSNQFIVKSEIIGEEMKISSHSLILLENARKGFVISRAYNGI